MKNLRFLLLCMGVLTSAVALSQITLPPSGNNQKSEVSQYLGLVKVTITYSSPDVGGRKIWGELVPYGMANLGIFKSTEQNPSPWRAGANENTTISFSHDVEIEGKPLKAGLYGLHMIPGNSEFIVIFSNTTTAWGSFYYVPSEDALRVPVKPVPCEFNEFLTYEFTDRLQNSATARLKWAELAVPFKISVPNGDDLYIQKLRKDLVGPLGFNWLNVVAAANFCTTKKLNLEEALGWVQSLIDRNIKYFPIYNSKGNVLAAMGKQAEADAVMLEAINLPDANPAQITNYGRSLIGQKRNKEALAVFQAGDKKFPGNSITLLGLARGYSAMGDHKQALKYAQAALKAESNAATKTSIEGMIKKLEKGEGIN